LDHDFEDEIKKCFDEQYQDDVNAVSAFQTAYEGKTKELLRIFDEALLTTFPRADFGTYKEKLETLRAIIQANLAEIQKKVDKPAITVEIKNIDVLVMELDEIIEEINKQIKTNNDGVAAKKDTKIKCNRMLWEYFAFLVKDEVADYKKKDGILEAEEKKLETDKAKKRQLYLDKDAEIKAESGKTVNTDDAFESINAMLLDSGFQGFSLRKKPGANNRYEVVRDGGRPVKKLSEGERNFIAFLYFYHLVRGSGRADTAIIGTDGSIQDVTDTRDKIVIIDDPVSSMDSGTLFIVSSMVREMIGVCHNNVEMLNPDITGNYIKQIFILTHNAYFHREITYNQVDFYDSVSFYMIRKIDNHSSINLCVEEAKELSQDDKNVNPVQNAYTALWAEYKELQSSIPLLNVIRRILEYYFMELCGYQGQGIRDTILKKHKSDFITKRADGTIDDNDYHLAYSMLSYIDNDSSFIDGFNLVQEVVDPNQYRKVTKKIFEKMGQSQHYKMMCGE
jgi:wobble nucleotide-excising tRNase